MKKTFTAPRVFTGVLLLFLVTVIVAVMIIPSLSFFEVVFDRLGINSAKVELIFDRLNFDNTAITSLVDENGEALFVESDEWGTERNPYVISEKYHVQNLSVLQNNGFFKETRTAQSFFLVCTSDGLPVAIDCEGMTLAPVGTHSNPFTGVIKGAPLAGEAEYIYVPRSSNDGTKEESYGVSTSTIGNLIVEANLSEPDIGFFGCIGYYGTATTDPETGAPAISGYAANIQDILLADVTISAAPSLAESLLAWWNSFTGHKTTAGVVGAEGVDVSAAGNKETHHIGVVAGHAEYATVNNISVFYTQGVQTFALSGSSYINYYSTTGLVGMLHYVNPTIKSGNMLVGDGNSVSDGDMVEGGLGGGGTISGTLTGYMLAETLFSEHEKYLTAQSLGKADIYNVKDMKKSDGTALFETVQMQEGTGSNKKTVTYCYFKDSVFTFAMSASDADQSAGLKDYVQKLWKLEEETPLINATNDPNKWSLANDPDATSRVAYKLTSITSQSQMVNGGHYVIAYYNESTGKTYIFDMNESGYCLELSADNIYGEKDVDTENGEVYDAEKYNPQIYPDGSYKSVTLIGTKKKYYDSAIRYNSGATISNPAPGSMKFGLCFERDASLGWLYATLSAPTLNQYSGSSEDSNWQATNVYYNDWTFDNNYVVDVPIVDADGNPVLDENNNPTYQENQPVTLENGKMAIYIAYSQSTDSLLGATRYGYYRFRFASNQITFDSASGTGSSSLRTQAYEKTDANGYLINPWDEGNLFMVYSIEINEVNDLQNAILENGLGGDNLELTPTNLLPIKKDADGELMYDDEGNPILDTAYSFDPSKYVFEQTATGYKLAPISSYNLNNGKGKKLEQLNHIVKMAQATPQNYQFELKWDLGAITDWINSIASSNSGGVVSAEIGTTGHLYAIPAGMIAFYIDEEVTNPDNPSYINIIVAVNPEQAYNGKVGLWNTSKTQSDFGSTFDLNNPDQYFTLPKSITGDAASDSMYTITVSDYVTQKFNADGTPALDANGKPIYESSNSTSYVYLGGQVALVYHSFEVTEGGIYLLGSGNAGPLSVSYFSVSGAAGQGADGTSTSPLGDVDFVYAYNGKIVTIDNKFEGIQDPTNENYALYYPSYHFIVMKGEGTTTKPLVQNETIKVYRYIDPNDSSGTKRHIKIIGCTNAEPTGLADMYEDDLEE